MKHLILISALLFSFNSWAYSESDVKKYKYTGACVSCDLSGYDFSETKLGGSDFRSANLTGATLMFADLTGANLTGAKLGMADLSKANLTDVDLSTTGGVEDFRLDGAKLCRTKLPSGHYQKKYGDQSISDCDDE